MSKMEIPKLSRNEAERILTGKDSRAAKGERRKLIIGKGGFVGRKRPISGRKKFLEDPRLVEESMNDER